MANNFFNAIQTNVSADSTLPTAVYTTPASKKSILIELDVANKSSSGVTVTVQICDASANSSGTGNAHTASAIATNTTGLITTTSSALTFDTNGASVTFTKIYLADIVRDAPVPVGSSLKVISGQKFVLEAGSSPEQDKIYVYSSAANAVDAIGSVLQEVS